jgi:hypothetical protein
VSARLKLAGIFAVCAAPFVLGWAAWYFGWGTGAPGNYGELIAPRTLDRPPFSGLRGKWLLVSFDRAACDEYCQKKLYFMRQVRTAQGKDKARVERLWIITDNGAPSPELVAQLDGTHVVQVGPGDLPGSFPGRPHDHIYVVDPLGNLMMRYPKDPDASKILKDLQRLLKYSQVG